MDRTLLTTIAVTGFSVAFFHAAIPTHWLPFVLVSRAQQWSRPKTLMITTLAGCGHVLFTAILGFLIAWCGISLSDRVGHWFPWIAGGALLIFGLYYVVQQLRGRGCGHSHLLGDHGHFTHSLEGQSGDHVHTHHDQGGCGHDAIMEQPPRRKSDWAAIVGLLALLSFSPCEVFLPVYVSGVQYGWHGFLVLTLILSVATVAGMAVFTGLALMGLEKLELKFFERYEAGLLGSMLCILGILVILFEP